MINSKFTKAIRTRDFTHDIKREICNKIKFQFDEEITEDFLIKKMKQLKLYHSSIITRIDTTGTRKGSLYTPYELKDNLKYEELSCELEQEIELINLYLISAQQQVSLNYDEYFFENNNL